MKNIKFKFLAFALVLSTIAACTVSDDENYCFNSFYTAVKSVSGPDTTTINVPITINVSLTPLNDCGKFNRFSETTTFPKDIKVLVDYEGCNCGITNDVITKPYTFTATTAGTYVLRFLTANPDAPVTKTITVTE